MCEQGLGMRPSWIRLSACSRESQQALAALATLSVSLLAVHAAALQEAGQSLSTLDDPPQASACTLAVKDICNLAAKCLFSSHDSR